LKDELRPLNDKEHRTRKALPRPLVVALEVSRAKIAAALVDERARILVRRQQETPQATTRATVSALAQLTLEVADSAERDAGEIGAIGLSVPGIVDPRTERVSAAEIKGWERLPLRQMIEHELEAAGLDIRTPFSEKRARAEKTASAHPTIVLSSDRSACIAAEAWCGAARGKQHAVFLAIGNQIQAGLLADGRIIHGAGDTAGAAGRFALSESFKSEYASRGCLEAEAGEAALVRRTIEAWSGSSDSLLGRLTAADATQLTPATIIRAARGGDPLAVNVITDICRWIGRGVAEMISLLNPEVVVIGGRLGLALRPFLNHIRREARLWTHPLAARQCRIMSSTLGDRIGLLGAARLAWWRIGPPA
jgi:glucokinase